MVLCTPALLLSDLKPGFGYGLLMHNSTKLAKINSPIIITNHTKQIILAETNTFHETKRFKSSR